MHCFIIGLFQNCVPTVNLIGHLSGFLRHLQVKAPTGVQPVKGIKSLINQLFQSRPVSIYQEISDSVLA